MNLYLVTLGLFLSLSDVVQSQSVFTENFSSFRGSGFSPEPSDGQLDSDSWALYGVSETSLNFGDTQTSGSFARGTISAPGVPDIGVYGLDNGMGTTALWVLTDKAMNLIMKVPNPFLNLAITNIDISFDILVYNDAPGVATINFYAGDSLNNLQTSVVDPLITDEAADTTPSITTTTRSTSLSVDWQTGTDMYFRWSSGLYVETSGTITPSSYDEFGLTNIAITITPTPSVNGDPHFSTFGGLRYDYHGQCGLVMVDAPFYNKGNGFRLLVRTKIHTWFSFVSNVVIVFGSDVIEITFDNHIFINGEKCDKLPRYFAQHEMKEEECDADEIHHYHQYQIMLHGGEILEIASLTDLDGYGMMFVNMKKVSFDSDHFAHSNGLMGDFQSGDLVSRDGSKRMSTSIESLVEIVESWQLQNDEDSLFHDTSYSPQYPANCVLPKADESAEKYVISDDELLKQAKEMCDRWGERSSACIYDVTRTGDLGYAVHGKY